MKVLAAILLLLCSSMWAQSTLPAITSDPTPNASKPAAMEELALTSHGATVNGLVYIASGAEPHPIVILLHGFPGYEQNLDLAQAIRRAGWDVLFFHYRGSWGSHGDFSFSNAQEDTAAAIAWVRDPQNASKYRIDPSRIVLIGHSMGGFMAAAGAAHDPKIAAVGMIAAWNIGADSSSVADRKAEFALEMGPLAGCTPDSLLAEIASHKAEWNYNSFAPQLKTRPILVVSTNDGLAPANYSFIDAVKKAGGRQITSVHLDSDHGFNDHRIALETAVLAWLGKLSK
jgi:uncharacterized protein